MSNWFTRMFQEEGQTFSEIEEINILSQGPAMGVNTDRAIDALREKLEAKGLEVDYQCWNDTYVVSCPICGTSECRHNS